MTTAVDMHVRQGDCFRLLAACFYEPEKEFFLQERLCDNLATLLSASACEKAARAAGRMKKGLAEQEDQDLKIEHARLFLGPFELVAPPYGSVYLEEKRSLMGDSTIAVHKIYQEFGLVSEVKEAPDHIALELEFMNYLCLNRAHAEEIASEDAVTFSMMQARFMGHYLGPWIPYFCNDIRNGTSSHFYASLADCLESFTTEMIAHYASGQLNYTELKHDSRASAEQF